MRITKCLILIFALSPIFVSAQNFVSPIGGVPYKDWTIVNYVDLDSGSGVLDWNGGSYSYNGHNAIDYTLPNFAAMDAGVAVYAVQSGTVIATHDGEYDRWSRTNPNPGDDSNYIVLDHGSGLVTEYLHLKKNSISVSVGDTVTAGQAIAQVGSSGYSTDPHLHFAVYQSNNQIETYLNPSLWWLNPLPYAGDVVDVLDFGVDDHHPSTQELVDRPIETDVFFLDDGPGQLVVSWANVHGFKPGDSLDYYFYQPDGSEFRHWSWTTPLFRYGWWTASIGLPNNAQTGEWSIEVEYNGAELFSDNFTVLTSQLCNGLTVTVDISLGQLPTAGDDVIWGTTGDDAINARGGNDTICALGGHDLINAGSGNDTVFAGAGDDVVIGGSGDDTIYGENGDDYLNGQSGEDFIDGGLGIDNIRGGPHADTIHTGPGATVGHSSYVSGGGAADIITGGADADDLRGAGGSDTIYGNGGDDSITGGNGRDTIYGGLGNDNIKGQVSRDTLYGDEGDDYLHGGSGNDTIAGGEGDDSMIGSADTDSCDGNAGTDTANTCESVTNVP